MATSNVESDQACGALANVAEAEREEKMDQRYTELAALLEEESVSQMTAMAKAEYDLTDAELRVFTLSRLRTWLRLDKDVAREIAACYDGIMKRMPGPVAMRRVSLVQTLARDFSNEDRLQLLTLVPNVFAGITDVTVPIGRSAPPPAASAAPAKKGWWPFRRG